MEMSDTSADVRNAQLRLYAAMSGEQRVLLALEMSDFMRELHKVGIRQQHPEWTEAEVHRELLRRILPAAVTQ